MFKKFYLFLTLLLMALFLLPWSGIKADPSTLTVADGTATNAYLPIYGYYADTRFKNQFIYPASILEDMIDGTISKLTFHSSAETLSFSGSGKITVKLAEVDQTTLSAFLNPDFTTVYVGAFSVTNSELSLAFSEEYTYNGGDLLVQIELTSTASNCPNSSFYGISSTGSGWCKYQSYGSGSTVAFLPKATFTYTAAAPVTCAKPTTVEVTDENITSNSATITLAGLNNATVEYKLKTATDWTVAQTGVNEASFELTGLNPYTEYDIQVKNVCGGTDGESKYTSASFRTKCGAIAELATYGFEDVEAGYGKYNIPACWNKVASGNYPYVYAYNSGVSGNSLYFNGGITGTSEQIIILPDFIPALNTLTISFFHKESKDELWYGTQYTYAKFEVGYYVGSTFTRIGDPLEQIESSYASEPTEVEITGDIPAGARLAIRYAGGVNSGSGYIDNIRVFPTPSCTKPTVNNATDETFEGATFTWTAGGSETQWQYIVVGSGAAEDWSSPTLTSTNSVTLTGYNAATTFDFYVRSYCSSSEQSESVKKSFTTLAVTAPTAPQVANATTTTADFSWNAAAGVSGYLYVTALSGQEPDWNNAQSTTATSVQLTNLLPGNTYVAYVRSFYSNNNCYSAVVTSDAFDTQCEAKTIDADHTFTETFDALHCWTLTNCVSNTGLNNNVFRFWYGYSNQYLISPELDTEDRQVTVEFDYHKHTSGTETFMVGYSTTTKEVSAFTFGDVITSTNTSDLRYSENLPAGVKYIAIAYTSYDQYYFYIDNFTVTEYVAPACAAPESVSVVENSVTPEGATLSWTSVGEGAEYQYAVKESGDPEDGDWSATTETSVAISGKTAGTTYTFYVRTKCTTSESAVVTTTFTPVIIAPTVLQAANITSSSAVLSWTAADGISKYEVLCLREGAEVEWTGAAVVENETYVTVDTLAAQTNYVFYVRSYYVSETLPAGARSTAINKPFQTKCAPFVVSSSASYEEHFESGIPACWDATEVVDSWSQGYRWESNNAGKTGKCLRFNNYYVNHILATEPISLTADANLTFYYKNTQGATFQVMISVEGADRVDLGDALGTATDWTKKEIDLTAYTGNTVQLFFYNEYKTSYGSYLWLDELTIEAWPACRKPATINPVTEFTATTATVTWTAGGTETNYQYAVALKDEAPVWDPANVVEALSVELTGLTPITNYDVYVRTYCSVSEQSEAQKVSFQTDCGAVNAPVEIEFSNALPGCWTASDATYTWAPYNRGSGNYCVRFDSYMNDNGNTADLQTAQYKLENNLTLKFSCKNKDGGAFSVDMYVVEDDQTVNLFTDLTGIADWTVKEYNLAAYAGKTVYFTFHGTSNEHDYYNGVDAYLYVDDFRLIRSLTLADDADNSATLASFAGQTFDDVTLGRTIFCDGDYNTICLPFDLATLDGTPLEGATVKAFKYAVIEPEELQVRVIDVEGGLQAGVPYLLKMTADENLVNPLFKNVTISATAAQTVGEDQAVEFVGTFAPVEFTAGNQNTLFVYTENNLTWAGKEGTSLKAFRAYFNRTSGAGAPLRHGMRARIVEHTENATGIENGGWFNGESAIKVLENNQVVIIRNGVKYTVQGQKIQ